MMGSPTEEGGERQEIEREDKNDRTAQLVKGRHAVKLQ